MLDMKIDLHVKESHMNKTLSYCSHTISTTRLIPKTLGHTAPGTAGHICLCGRLWSVCEVVLVPYVDAVVAGTVMCVMVFVLHVRC